MWHNNDHAPSRRSRSYTNEIFLEEFFCLWTLLNAHGVFTHLAIKLIPQKNFHERLIGYITFVSKQFDFVEHRLRQAVRDSFKLGKMT